MFTILARGWSSAAGLVTVFLIARFLSPAEQGYYYTFGSLVALQIVFELGFSVVILQLASHEAAHLLIGSDGEIRGDAVAHARIASVLQKSVRWYSTGALLMAVVLIPLGLYFFSTHAPAGQAIAWQLPWILVVLAATFTFQIDPVLSFSEGCGLVANIAQLRMAQALLGSLFAWLALIGHHGLFAPACTIFGQIVAAGVWLHGRRRLFVRLLRHDAGDHRILWLQEVWPFQWRIAISWLSGYFIYQIFNPVLFAYKGAIAAGQMGMSLTIMGALTSVSIAWVNTKAAPFGALIARKQYAELDRLFFRALVQCLTVCGAGGLCVWLGALYLNSVDSPLARRILDPFPLGMLLLATLINVAVFGLAIYLRAHKQEKFLLSSILGAIFVGSSTYFVGKIYGAVGMTAGYLVVGILLGLGYNVFIFIKYRREWHADA